MPRSIRAMLAATVVGGVIAGLVTYALLTPEALPEPHRPVHKDVFPELDYGAASVGTAVKEIYASFGRKPANQVTQATTRCVFFRYDPELYDGTLVVLTAEAVVKERWLVKAAGKPPECSSLPEELIDLRGWYAAAVRVR